MAQKRLLYWFFGERAGRVIASQWAWFWGKSLDDGGPQAVALAEQALQDYQESVVQLTEAVATQVAAFKRANDIYQAKVREHDDYLKQALVAKQSAQKDGVSEAKAAQYMEMAAQAMSKVLTIEELLPVLKQRVEAAEAFAKDAHDKLRETQRQMESYKDKLQNMKALNELNEALGVMEKVASDNNINSAKTQFEAANSAVQQRTLKTQAFAQLSENPGEKAAREVRKLSAASEIDKRLAMLGEAEQPKLLGDGENK